VVFAQEAMPVIDVDDFSTSGWRDGVNGPERARWYCERLEGGEILRFRRSPFALPDVNITALLGVRQRASSHVKNISYRPDDDRVRGVSGSADEKALVHRCLRAYSIAVREALARFLSPYARHWRLDLASYRPIEEEGRRLSLRARNDLLHVDSFPTRPTNGSRILRVFANVNPNESRAWQTTETFDVVAPRHAAAAGLSGIAAGSDSPAARAGRVARALGRRLGLRFVERPAYDRFMLAFHHWMKASDSFQTDSPRFRWEFPPGSVWLVFTDMVPHAVVSGRHALEQTFLIPPETLVCPDKAPVRIAEALCGRRLTL
jgi:3-deoxy-D-manno-octulosonic acid hydroxylase-like protein